MVRVIRVWVRLEMGLGPGADIRDARFGGSLGQMLELGGTVLRSGQYRYRTLYGTAGHCLHDADTRSSMLAIVVLPSSVVTSVLGARGRKW